MIHGTIKNGDIVYCYEKGEVESYVYVGFHPHKPDLVILVGMSPAKKKTRVFRKSEFTLFFYDKKSEVYQYAARKLKEKLNQYEEILSELGENED